MGKFSQILTELSAHHKAIFLFLYNNLSKYPSVFTELGMCIDTMEIWFKIANGQILSIFDRVICLPHNSCGVLSFHVFIFSVLVIVY